jgi:ribose 5-phosphate isomerase
MIHRVINLEREKQFAAQAAADLIEHGMTVGLGTGSTVAFLLPALARRSLDILCIATSPGTEHAARKLGLRIENFASIERFDIALDGADQIAPDGWLVKGGGGAHTREKIDAAAADRFVVIADSTKPVEALHSPIPPGAASLRVARHNAPDRAGLTARRPAQPRRRRHRRIRRAGGRSGRPQGQPSALTRDSIR